MSLTMGRLVLTDKALWAYKEANKGDFSCLTSVEQWGNNR
jgi:hypothetical protein